MSGRSPGGSDGKAPACNAGDPGSIPGSGRSTGEGNGNPLQYSCLENSMDGEAWWATVHGVTKSWAQLSDFTFTVDLQGCSSPRYTEKWLNYTHTHTHTIFRFFSLIGYYKMLSIVPCVLFSRSLLVIYFIYSSVQTHFIWPALSWYLKQKRTLLGKRTTGQYPCWK